jgi:hypothetical protein
MSRGNLLGAQILQVLQTGMVYASTRTVNHRGNMSELINGVDMYEGKQARTEAEPKNKPGRPKGFDGTRSRMPSALAQSFKKAGLDWKEDFAKAIKENKRERIKLWLKLLPYMITTTKRAKVGRWKGKASKAAMIALQAMEQDI